MACRKDGKGRVLRKGEGYRKGDGRYSYVYVDPLGKKRTIYAKSLVKLREREEQLKKDQLDGLDVYVAGKADVNFLFDRYISTKTELRSTTYSNYLYTYVTFTVTTSEGEEVEMAVVDEFTFENKNYVAAARVVDDTIDEEGLYLYKVKLGDEDFSVEKISNKVEYEKIAKAYMEMGEWSKELFDVILCVQWNIVQ